MAKANIHFKTAWDHIRRAPFQALAATFVLTTTFFVVTVLAFLVYASGQVLNYFETRPEIIAFINDQAENDEINLLQSSLENDTRIKEVKYVSKEEALEIYKRATSDNPLLSELVSPSIFPASLEISVLNLSNAEQVIEELKSKPIVEQVGFTASLGGEDTLGEVVSRLKTVTFYIRLGGGAFAALLAATSFLVLIVIISMRMTMRRGEIEILDLIGATPGFIRSPIIIEALIYAVFGVIMGWLLAFILVLYATPSLISYFGDITILPKDTVELFVLFGVILSAELLVGLFLAFVGSMMAVSRVRMR